MAVQSVGRQYSYRSVSAKRRMTRPSLVSNYRRLITIVDRPGTITRGISTLVPTYQTSTIRLAKPDTWTSGLIRNTGHMNIVPDSLYRMSRHRIWCILSYLSTFYLIRNTGHIDIEFDSLYRTYRHYTLFAIADISILELARYTGYIEIGPDSLYGTYRHWTWFVRPENVTIVLTHYTEQIGHGPGSLHGTYWPLIRYTGHTCSGPL